MRVAKHRRARGRAATSWRNPSVGRRFTIAAVVCIVIGILGSGWFELLYLLFPAGLILTAVAFFKGDRLGLWLVLGLFAVVRIVMVILALQKYG